MQKTQKIVEDYKLEATIQIMANGIHVLRATHIKTNQVYTIKKVNISPETNDINLNNGEEALMKEITILKNLSIRGLIKCLKFIRTKRNIYCIFQEYPTYQLTEYLTTFQPPFSEKIKYAQIVCEMLLKVHEKGYAFGNLHPGCILVDHEQKTLKFVGSENLTEIKKNGSIKPDSLNQYMSPEVKKNGKVSIASDAYSLGKILVLLGISNPDHFSAEINTPIQSIIKNLLSPKPNIRPSLKSVSLCLEIKSNEKSTEDSSSSFTPQKSKKYHSVRLIGVENVSAKNKSFTKQRDLKKLNQSHPHENEKKIKQILKIRNLSLFILGLAKFCCYERSFKLSRLLFQKSIIIMGNLTYGLKKDPMTAKDSLEELLTIITQQYNEQKLFLQRMDQYLPTLKSEEKFDEIKLEEQIKVFLKGKRKHLKETKTNFHSEQRKVLMKLYHLSEKISYGSFEKFFEEAFTEDQVKLEEQRYLQYLSMLPTKELIEKIDKVINS